jgi:ATP-dependent RNA helicase DeaD
MNRFKQLGMIQPIVRVIEEEGFKKPTEIQEKSVPLVVQGKDVIAGSATGSGKTLAFGAAIIQNCQTGAGIQALVLTPTRELCQQVSKSLVMFSKYKPLEVVSVYGGEAINPQIMRLRGADIVVGTPGRILDHLNRKTIFLKGVRTLVLDEADRMLDMGFIDDVEKIIKECPTDRQTLLFSATITYNVTQLSKRYMKDPKKVSAEVYVDASKLSQVYYDVDDREKFSLLVDLLKNEKADLVMVFCNTRHNTDFVAKNLKINGIRAMAIHGGFTQDKRNRAMDEFHSKSVNVLVCTDVAARGLDIKGVSHVYNFDIPKDSKDYVHRIGRTARAGEIGFVVNILTRRDWDNFTKIIKNNNLDVDREEMYDVPRAKIGWKEPPRNRDFRGRPGGFRRSGPQRGRPGQRHHSGQRRSPPRHSHNPSRGR